MKMRIALALLASSCLTLPAAAATFNLSTLNEQTSGRTILGWYQGSTKILSSTVSQVAPWTEGSGSTQASLNFGGGTLGNQGGKIYVTSGALFPIPAGQSLGTGQSGYSGVYELNNGFPIWFAFSNPTYDGPGGSLTPVQVTLDSFYTSGNVNGITVTAYSDYGHTPIPGDTMMLSGNTGTGVQQFTFDWTGVAYVTLSGNGQAPVYLNDIQVNEAIAAVPEPSTWAMLMLGFVGLGLAFRQSRRKVSFA